MLNVIVVSIHFILLILGGQKQVASENVALQQQLPCSMRRSAAKTERSRSIILGRPADDLAGLEIGIGNRAAGNGNFVAPQAFQTVLVEAIPT